QRIKPQNGAEANGDENKGKARPSEDQASPIDETRRRRHLKGWVNDEDRHSQSSNGAQFQKRAQIIARRKEQPDRQRRSSKAINDDRPGEPFLAMTKPGFNRRRLVKKLAAPDREEQA